MGRLATDIGGTFTDLVHFDEETGALSVAKSLSTPRDLTRGVLDTIEQAGLDAEKVDYFVHGGTTVINAITERTGAKTALVTTEGFRDVLEIARGNRPDLYNLRYRKEVPFVPRRLRFEVRERIDARGRVRTPLHLEDLDPVIEVCRAEGVEAIAIQFLHSYAAPAHEAACEAYLRERLPGVGITASHEITREWREYERANTAVLNAYVQPIVQRYFDTLEAGLDALGLACPKMAMQSNGGTTSFGWARAHPITLLESGPAAGVNGAALIGRLCGEPNVIYLDIGGTTAKCSTIEDGAPAVTTDYRLEATRIRYGYPVRVPVVDIVEIGAGGGSIAWFDDSGGLCVGPRSAGADPGPACYGRGGSEPTVTDAKLITGVLNPANFAGGRLALDIGRARTAMGRIADGLGCSVDEAAVAVIRVVDANMINALKLVSIQRGHDPRDFALMVGGGGGAMHGASLGRELGVKEIAVPRFPGLFSAWGMLATAPRRDFMRTALQRAETLEIAALRALFAELRAEAEDYFAAEGGHGYRHRRLPCRHALRRPGARGDRPHRSRRREPRGAARCVPRRPRARLHLPPRRHAGGARHLPPHRHRRRRPARAHALGSGGPLGGGGGTRYAPGGFRRGRPARDRGLRPRPAAAGVRGRRSSHRRGAVFDHAGLPRPACPGGRAGLPQDRRGMSRR